MNIFPGVVTGNEESKLLLDVGIVWIPVGLHSAEKIVLDGQCVSFTKRGKKKNRKVFREMIRMEVELSMDG